MSKHNSRHSSNRSPAEMMMSGRHYASGGSTGGGGSGGNSFLYSMPSNIPHFNEGGIAQLKKGGGRPQSYMRNGRACHAEGDSVLSTEQNKNPITGHKYGSGPTSYSESVDKLRKGGRAHHHRRRHAEGDSVEKETPQEKYMYDSNLRKGGRARRRHAEGDSVENEKEGVPFRKGGRARHDFGDSVKKVGSKVFHALSHVAPFLPFLLSEGGSTDRDEGDGTKLAAGGAGKVRKGMMTRKGRII